MIKRYEWEDALIVAQRDGYLSNGGLTVCLKLARAINWSPKQGRTEPGLYWKNDEAFADVGLGRSTYYHHRRELFDLGFFELVRGNLVPRLPESMPESVGSTTETNESVPQTQKSTGEQPFTVDTFPVHTCSKNVFNVDRAVAGAPAMTLGEEEGPSSLTSNLESSANSPNHLEFGGPEEFRESLTETTDEAEYSLLMADWYARHPAGAITAMPCSAAVETPRNKEATSVFDSNVRSLRGPSEQPQRKPEGSWGQVD